MKRISKIQSLANLATLMLGLILSAVLVKSLLAQRPSSHPTPIFPDPGRGISLKDWLHDIDWATNGRSLIFALSTMSPYCNDSVEFYRRIEEEKAKDVKLVALFQEPVGSGRKYLEDEGLRFDDVRRVRVLQFLGVKGTPTLMLVDDSGTILDAWQGELSPNEEDEVIAAVKQSPSVNQSVQVRGGRPRTVDIEPENLSDAVKIVRISEGGMEVLPGRFLEPYLPGKPFQAGDNWLRDLSITLKNQTSKKIAFVWVTFIFPQDESNIFEGHIYWELMLGQPPANTLGTFNHPREVIPKGTGRPLNFAPGQEMTISLGDYIGPLKARIEGWKPFASVNKCIIAVNHVYFDDGMRWSNWGAGYAQPFGDHWATMGGTFFPGEMNPIARQ